MIKKKVIEQVVKVDHAGEYGAVQIYSGQLKALGEDSEIQGMLEQEEVHCEFFSEQILEKGARPTVFLPIWKLAGFAAGFISATCSRKAAMACTIAVEETIDEHYQKQIDMLKKFNWNPEIVKKIEKFREEELEHRDIGIQNQGKEAKGYKVLSKLTSCGCKLAIFISKHW